MYQAVLFSTDGDYVTDHRRETVEEVCEALNDQGSKWFFYPFAFVIRTPDNARDTREEFMRRRVVSAPDWPGLRDLSGKSVATARRYLLDNNAWLIGSLA